MTSITINEEVDSADSMATLLRIIASSIEEGNTSGYYPTWELQGEGEATDD